MTRHQKGGDYCVTGKEIDSTSHETFLYFNGELVPSQVIADTSEQSHP